MSEDLSAPNALTARPMLARSTLPLFHGSEQPTYRYLKVEGAQWVTFEDATRFELVASDTPAPAVAPPSKEAVVEWVADLPRDLDGWPYDPDDGPYAWRLTRCCAAATSINDGPLYCKSCYQDQPLEADTPPRLDGNWRPGDGPARFVLGPE